MNLDAVKKELQSKYPDKFIVENKIDNLVTEVLCEIEPTSDHPEYSEAIAIIDKSLPHYHKHLVETYFVLRGELTLNIEGKVIQIKEGDTYIIEPNMVHWAQGKETWVEVSSNPGWTPEDHIFTQSAEDRT